MTEPTPTAATRSGVTAMSDDLNDRASRTLRRVQLAWGAVTAGLTLALFAVVAYAMIGGFGIYRTEAMTSFPYVSLAAGGVAVLAALLRVPIRWLFRYPERAGEVRESEAEVGNRLSKWRVAVAVRFVTSVLPAVALLAAALVDQRFGPAFATPPSLILLTLDFPTADRFPVRLR